MECSKATNNLMPNWLLEVMFSFFFFGTQINFLFAKQLSSLKSRAWLDNASEANGTIGVSKKKEKTIF